MAKQQRKAPKSKPITANPLFPAVVALWCATFLGGASLAVRTSLLETLVIKSGIDLILAAAAPPLGITARILIALGCAAVGAAIGIALARRIARPRLAQRERKRSARGSEAGEPRIRASDGHPDAPIRRPISAHEELGGEIGQGGSASAPGALAGRRRTLAISEEPVSFVPHELAPLPGGQPQILDLAGAELDQVEPEPAMAAPRTAAPAEAPDLNAYEDAEPRDARAPVAAAEPVALDWSQSRPILPGEPAASTIDAIAAGPRQVFHAAPEAAEEPHPALEDHLKAGRQVFGVGPVEPQEPEARQIFGAAAIDARAPSAFVEAVGGQASAFANAPAPPLFSMRLPTDPEAAATAASALAASELPPVANLGMTDLAARLQDSMKRRRAAKAARAASPVAPPPLPVSTGPASTDNSPLVAAAPSPAFRPMATELPAALRPLAFDDPADDDGDDTLASLLPPRHRPGPVAPVSPTGDSGQLSALSASVMPRPFGEPAAPIEAGDNEGGDLADEGYASLLRLNPHPARNPFVRIEEPEGGSDAVEPVVIFPGQAPRVPLGAASFAPLPEVAPVVSPPADEHAAFRRFDAPANASAGQSIAANQPAPAIDRDEAERALRSVLSNLQRISGAA